MSKALFKEKHCYGNKIVLIALVAIGLLTSIRALSFLVNGETSHYYDCIFLFTITLVIICAVWWLTRLKLKVAIGDKNIKFKMSPRHVKKRSIPWEEVEKCEIVKTSEAAQWSGRNITFHREKRFSLTGRNGLAIKTRNGECYFIGCKNIAKLRQTLNQLNIE